MRQPHQLKACTTIDIDISIFLISVRRVTLRIMGLLVEPDWIVICLLCC